MTKAELEVLNSLSQTIDRLNKTIYELHSNIQKEKDENRRITDELHAVKNAKEAEYDALPIETKLLKVASQSVVKAIAHDNWTHIDYKNRFEVPSSFLVEVYNAIDTNKLKDTLIENIEKVLAKKVLDAFLTSTENDIRNALNIPYIRDDLRMIIKNHIQTITKELK